MPGPVSRAGSTFQLGRLAGGGLRIAPALRAAGYRVLVPSYRAVSCQFPV
jgi:hypothetical protein